jgi:hypothetical protein
MVRPARCNTIQSSNGLYPVSMSERYPVLIGATPDAPKSLNMLVGRSHGSRLHNATSSHTYSASSGLASGGIPAPTVYETVHSIVGSVSELHSGHSSPPSRRIVVRSGERK